VKKLLKALKRFQTSKIAIIAKYPSMELTVSALIINHHSQARNKSPFG
jgi:hypothetical protein